MSTAPTRLSISEMRERGYVAEVVEKWNAHIRRTQDLFGFGDILAVGEKGVVIVQTTTRHNMKARIRKIESEDLAKAVAAVRKAGITILVHGWFKQRGRWHLREVDVS